jgi:CubicO group peptidase (beta-lactamase class C family)
MAFIRISGLFLYLLVVLSCLGLPNEASAQQQVDQAALHALERRSIETQSDAVLVYLDGKQIFDYRSKAPREPMYLMSCTKSITGLAVMEAITEGKITSIDEPVYKFFPVLNQGRKKLITIRMLLSMTSGIQHIGTGNEVYAAPDSVKQAVAAELADAPGSVFSYNNKAVSLLAGIVQIATGEQLDAYADEHFFTPMGISDWRWERDTAGNPYAMADLKLQPEDFAKFGTLILQKGQWQGKQLIAANWVDELGRQSQPYEPLYGLLWWRIPAQASGTVTDKHLAALSTGGLDRALVDKLQQLRGKTFQTQTQWHRALAGVIPDWEDKVYIPGVIGPYAMDVPTWTYQGFDGVSAEGYLGQYLVVFPSRKLVAIRMINSRDGYDFIKNRFEDFPDAVRALAH